ncbi:MAG: Flp pilus assembly complex ATPase component TadA [Kiritimatiellae bacterium]|nr:Flp pilus assembly complex ATPase component TadA [Kiritimatiellia bacterium]
MPAATSNRIASLLEATHLFSAPEIETFLLRARENGGAITSEVVKSEAAGEEAFLRALAEAMSVPFVRLDAKQVDRAALAKVPPKAASQYHVVPLSVSEDGTALSVAMNEPFARGVTEALRVASGGMRILPVLAMQKDIAEAAKSLYGVGAEAIAGMDFDDEDTSTGSLDLGDLDQEASVVKFVNQIIWDAHQSRGTDIHIEPMEDDLRIRVRVDGVLHPVPLPGQMKRLQSAIISRIKVMAGLDIAEKRKPQDGRISVTVKGEEIDIRVSTMPTRHGESVSLRLLMRSSGVFGMDKLGLAADDRELLDKLIRKPHGILLVTGPTGSGKSTSLYAWLHTINSVDKRILTVEDPIEYEMAGINQVQVQPEIDLTFARVLRAFLRQDPDVIMVGEIRDQETADIAIQASLTGHLVFSTLHTNDAAGAITRLVDMGVEPFLVASSVEALVAQRLVRRLCDNCKRPVKPDPEILKSMGFDPADLAGGTLHEAVGCEACRQTGFRGRTGIYEILTLTDKIRQMIVDNRAASEIKAEALAAGMRTLKMDGWRKALAGETTLEEVVRVASDDEGASADVGE